MKALLISTISVLMLCHASAQSALQVRIDPENAQGGQVYQLFDTIEYIPLETTSKSLFGRIDKLIVTRQYFFILDHSTDAVVLFTRDGRFYSKISLNNLIKTANSGSGIRDFTVNEATGTVLLTHWLKQNSLYEFDFQGKLKNIIKDKVWHSMVCIDSTHYLMESRGNISDSIKHVSGNCIITDESITSFQKFLLKNLESDFTLEAGGRNMTNMLNSNTVFYTRPYDYNAYLISAIGIQSTYQFLFPASYSLPKNFLDSNFIGKQQDYIFNHNVIFSLSDIYKIKQNLLFCIQKMQGTTRSSFIYNLTSGNLYSTSNISSDSTNGFLPTTTGGDGNILAADSNYFYTSVPAYELLSDYEEAKIKSTWYSLPLQAFLKKKNRLSNPIIVRVRPKENL